MRFHQRIKRNSTPPILVTILEIREELKKLNGQRRTFAATFERFGTKPGWNTGYRQPPPVKTALLLHIIDVKTGGEVTDHLWFSVGKRFDALDLHRGDKVQFDARVSTYHKFHRAEFNDEENFHYTDYKLSFPTQCKKTFTAPIQEEPTPPPIEQQPVEAMPSTQTGLQKFLI